MDKKEVLRLLNSSEKRLAEYLRENDERKLHIVRCQIIAQLQLLYALGYKPIEDIDYDNYIEGYWIKRYIDIVKLPGCD